MVKPVLESLKAIRETVEHADTNREELMAMLDRCTYITACFIVKCRRTPGAAMVVTPLGVCMEAVGKFFESCSGRGNHFSAGSKDSSDKVKIAELDTRLDRLTGDLDMAGIATFEGKADGMRAMLVSFVETMPRRSFARRS